MTTSLRIKPIIFLKHIAVPITSIPRRNSHYDDLAINAPDRGAVLPYRFAPRTQARPRGANVFPPTAKGPELESDPALYRELFADPRYLTTLVNTLIYVGIGVNVKMFL